MNKELILIIVAVVIAIGVFTYIKFRKNKSEKEVTTASPVDTVVNPVEPESIPELKEKFDEHYEDSTHETNKDSDEIVDNPESHEPKYNGEELSPVDLSSNNDTEDLQPESIDTPRDIDLEDDSPKTMEIDTTRDFVVADLHVPELNKSRIGNLLREYKRSVKSKIRTVNMKAKNNQSLEFNVVNLNEIISMEEEFKRLHKKSSTRYSALKVKDAAIIKDHITKLLLK